MFWVYSVTNKVLTAEDTVENARFLDWYYVTNDDKGHEGFFLNLSDSTFRPLLIFPMGAKAKGYGQAFMALKQCKLDFVLVFICVSVSNICTII